MQVEVCGWCEELRDLGKIKFIKLHTPNGDLQITAKAGEVSNELLELISEITRQSALKIRGKIKQCPEAPGGKELIPESIEVLARAEAPLPLDPSGKTRAELETRLDWRCLDLRNDKTLAIFKVQNALLQAFREFMLKEDFFEIQPPCIIASASEGGAELFPLPYFEKQAYLAQSPQLYKQICAISLGKVFCVLPVWRAERFNRPTHLNEIRQMDAELAFIGSEEDAMRVLEQCLLYMLQSVAERCKAELELLKVELKLPKLPLQRLSYEEAVKLLQAKGESIEWGQDLSKAQETKLRDELGAVAFFIKDWPLQLKPFYTMPKDEQVGRAFDLIHGGIEIASGTQRIHQPELLVERILAQGLRVEDFKHYVQCFKYGAPPHAGWSIGLERVTMSTLGLSNIRECCMFPRDRTRLLP